MNDSHAVERKRFEDLLADRATIGLSEVEHQELKRLADSLGVEIDDSVDLAAAAIDMLVASEERVPIPNHLKERIVAVGIAAVSEQLGQKSVVSRGVAIEVNGHAAPFSDQSRLRRRDLLSMFALAASLSLAAFLWYSRPEQPSALAAAELRQQMLQTNPVDLIKIRWQPTDENSNTSGDVVWSDQLQQGYMTFNGLKANNPLQEQYQLWIFDKNRDEKYPVDGGVFDVKTADKKVVVAINPKLAIDKVTLFAVTIERPGGVVVSDRSRLPLIAKVGE